MPPFDCVACTGCWRNNLKPSDHEKPAQSDCLCSRRWPAPKKLFLFSILSTFVFVCVVKRKLGNNTAPCIAIRAPKHFLWVGKAKAPMRNWMLRGSLHCTKCPGSLVTVAALGKGRTSSQSCEANSEVPNALLFLCVCVCLLAAAAIFGGSASDLCHCRNVWPAEHSLLLFFSMACGNLCGNVFCLHTREEHCQKRKFGHQGKLLGIFMPDYAKCTTVISNCKLKLWVITGPKQRLSWCASSDGLNLRTLFSQCASCFALSFAYLHNVLK